MNKSEIEKERKRLHGVLFEGAPDWADHAAMGANGEWLWLSLMHKNGWYDDGILHDSVNQPETTLDWKDTLIKRGDYE